MATLLFTAIAVGFVFLLMFILTGYNPFPLFSRYR